jgi:hypothetical protein
VATQLRWTKGKYHPLRSKYHEEGEFVKLDKGDGPEHLFWRAIFLLLVGYTLAFTPIIIFLGDIPPLVSQTVRIALAVVVPFTFIMVGGFHRYCLVIKKPGHD